MIYIAKMGTRYPDYHGEGYFNFIMAESNDELRDKLEDNSHDFYLINEVKTRHKSIEAVTNQYKTKYDLDKALFNKGE